MLEYTLNLSYVEEEKKIQNEINGYIDDLKSLVFKAGAGVGKTYALIETIKHIILKNEHRFEKTNEKIRVITFTNAATDEILSRIGTNSCVKCSTIHEFAWELISNYPRQLLDIHLEEVNDEIVRRNEKLQEPFFQEFIKTNNDCTIEELSKRENFYTISKAGEIREFYGLKPKNATEFHTAVKTYISIKKLENTKQRIVSYLDSNPQKINSEFCIKYDINSNIKNLNKMRIDHDLLLTYFKKIYFKYPLIKKVIYSKYPYLLIDEYQDTNSNIIECVSDIVKDRKYPIVVGFFGDESQNIYDSHNDFVNQLEKENSIVSKYKEFNRRCSTQVINVGNKINHLYPQTSIYLNHNDGLVQIIDGHDKELDDILRSLSSYGNIDCLILKNQTIAEKIKIGNLYEFYKKTGEYSGKNYERLNVELLSHDIDKLGKTQRLLFGLINAFVKCLNNKTFLSELFSKEIDINKSECIQVINLIRNINVNIDENYNFGDYLKDLFNIIKESNNINRSFKQKNFGFEYKLDEINNIFDALNFSEEKSLFDISFNEFLRWYFFITEKQEGTIKYHTYHNTKGLQYDNVVIVVEDKFRKNNDVHDFLLECINSINTGDYSKIDSDINKLLFRNLFYVAVTRSIKNLFIVNKSSLSNDELKVIFS